MRTQYEFELEAYRVLERMWEFPIIKSSIDRVDGDIEKAIDLVYKENSGFCIMSGFCGRGRWDHDVSLLKSSGYILLWAPENDDIMTRKPDFKLNIHQIFKLIKNGPTKQMELF